MSDDTKKEPEHWRRDAKTGMWVSNLGNVSRTRPPCVDLQEFFHPAPGQQL